MCGERLTSKLTVAVRKGGMDWGIGLSFDFVQL